MNKHQQGIALVFGLIVAIRMFGSGYVHYAATQIRQATAKVPS